jgi:hypothetical protein
MAMASPPERLKHRADRSRVAALAGSVSFKLRHYLKMIRRAITQRVCSERLSRKLSLGNLPQPRPNYLVERPGEPWHGAGAGRLHVPDRVCRSGCGRGPVALMIGMAAIILLEIWLSLKDPRR